MRFSGEGAFFSASFAKSLRRDLREEVPHSRILHDIFHRLTGSILRRLLGISAVQLCLVLCDKRLGQSVFNFLNK